MGKWVNSLKKFLNKLKTSHTQARYHMQRPKRNRREVENITETEYLETLIDRYQNLVFSLCYRTVGDYFAAQDLTQDTFLSVYCHLKEFDGQHEKAWICRIASNKSIDYLKAAGRRSVPTEDVGMEVYTTGTEASKSSLTQIDGSNNPEQQLLEKETREILLKRCRSLKPPYDEVAVLYFYEECKPEEVAAKTGRNIKTTQTQIYRARSQLRELYRRQWEAQKPEVVRTGQTRNGKESG